MPTNLCSMWSTVTMARPVPVEVHYFLVLKIIKPKSDYWIRHLVIQLILKDTLHRFDKITIKSIKLFEPRSRMIHLMPSIIKLFIWLTKA